MRGALGVQKERMPTHAEPVVPIIDRDVADISAGDLTGFLAKSLIGEIAHCAPVTARLCERHLDHHDADQPLNRGYPPTKM